MLSCSVTSEIWARNSSSGDLLGLALELAVGVELARDADQLLEVLDPALGLDRALGLERLDVAGLVQDRLEQLGHRAAALGALAQGGHRLGEAADRLVARRRPSAGIPPGCASTSQMSTPIVFACESIRAWVCWPIPRRGELTIRENEIASAGLASSCR